MKTRQDIKRQFPYKQTISQHQAEKIFDFCRNDLNLTFKQDFDVRATNGDFGSDFYFKDQNTYLIVKLKTG